MLRRGIRAGSEGAAAFLWRGWGRLRARRARGGALGTALCCGRRVGGAVVARCGGSVPGRPLEWQSRMGHGRTSDTSRDCSGRHWDSQTSALAVDDRAFRCVVHRRSVIDSEHRSFLRIFLCVLEAAPARRGNAAYFCVGWRFAGGYSLRGHSAAQAQSVASISTYSAKQALSIVNIR
jgi:hypothetical protein